MDRWAWEQIDPWLEMRRELPIGALLRVIHGTTAGQRQEASAARKQLHHAAAAAGVRRRFAPHQLRYAHAVEIANKGVPLVVIEQQLGRANLGITSVYLQGIDSSEIISTIQTTLADDLRHRRSADDSIDRDATGSALPVPAGPGAHLAGDLQVPAPRGRDPLSFPGEQVSRHRLDRWKIYRRSRRSCAPPSRRSQRGAVPRLRG